MKTFVTLNGNGKTDAGSKGVRNLAAVEPSTVCHNKVRK